MHLHHVASAALVAGSLLALGGCYSTDSEVFMAAEGVEVPFSVDSPMVCFEYDSEGKPEGGPLLRFIPIVVNGQTSYALVDDSWDTLGLSTMHPVVGDTYILATANEEGPGQLLLIARAAEHEFTIYQSLPDELVGEIGEKHGVSIMPFGELMTDGTVGAERAFMIELASSDLSTVKPQIDCKLRPSPEEEAAEKSEALEAVEKKI